MEQPSDLHLRVWGAGEPIVLIHGSNTADSGVTWARQRELAGRYRLLIPDRRGYGGSPAAKRTGFEVDVRDILTLMGDPSPGSGEAGAHLVGLSYGGVLALLAAARRPDLVHSLTMIEPPAFEIARDHPAVEQLLGRMAPLYAAAGELTPEAFITGFAQAFGQEVDEPVRLSPQHRRAIQTTMQEPPPWQAAIPLAALAECTFPKLVVSGDWHPAIEVTADMLARRIGAERAVIQGAGHAVQNTGKPFNFRLEALMRAAAPQLAD